MKAFTGSLIYTVFDSPLGLVGVAASKRGIVRMKLQLANEDEFLEYLASAHERPLLKKPGAFRALKDHLSLYFKGQGVRFDCPLDLNLKPATPFQIRVWRALRSIPYGETRSYQWLAGAVGHPDAWRAVGGANGKNPVPILVPCHRVVRKNGDLGGYSGGVHIKRFLIDLERARHGTT
ncbi:MAG: methylated-DNA--[protein]-cysteine S-methyltransferase [Nitrospinales bacterium]